MKVKIIFLTRYILVFAACLGAPSCNKRAFEHSRERAIERINIEDTTFQLLSKELVFYDEILNEKVRDPVSGKEVDAKDAFSIQRYFLANDRKTMFCVTYFVTEEKKGKNKVATRVKNVQMFGNLPANGSKVWRAQFIQKSRLDTIQGNLIEKNEAALDGLRRVIDGNGDISYYTYESLADIYSQLVDRVNNRPTPAP